MTRKIKNNKKWFLLGLLAVVIAAPNATIVKYTTNTLDPVVFNFLRFGFLTAVTMPYVLLHRKKVTHRGLLYSIVVGVSMFIAVTSYVLAIEKSQASYVSIVGLTIPIFFLLLAAKLVGEKLTKRSIAGVTLAALGAFVVIFFPIAFSQNSGFQFYPLATALALLNSLSFSLAIIYSKKAHETGIPITATFGISSVIIFALSGLLLLVTGQGVGEVGAQNWVGILYSGLAVSLLSRVLGVLSYEHVGAAVNSALGYVETLLAILVPILVLGESISKELVAGGALILLGVYVVEHHKSPHHKHFQFFRHH